VDIARDHVPHADLYVHDIVEAPLPRQYGGVFFTGTLEHVSAPNQALSNIYESLRPGGFLFLSFPNRLAWWPWYYLRGVSYLVGRWPRLAHWVAWFTRPYEMRSDQPLDHAYSRNQVRRLILSSGFVILNEAGRGLLPMCRITGVSRTEEFVSIVEGWAHEFLRAQIMYYHYLFVCQKPTRTTRARGAQEEIPTPQS
jgi:SAM-dependent methyltransferase